MKTVPLAVAFLALSLLPATAADFADPKALVGAIFSTYQPGQPKGDPTEFYSSRLRTIADHVADEQVFTNDRAMSGAAFVAEPVFNPFLPDDNALLFDLAIGEPTIMNERAMVSVSYHNFDEPRLLALSLVREEGGWKVDDVASLGNDEPWLLSWLLTNDPYRN